jgi:glucose-1-phosphate cytidylyltransferase
MKVAILAGGMGTRLGQETQVRPKPMVQIGPQPILWHIMKLYSAQGFREFVIACGYLGEEIKRYWVDYTITHSDLTVRTAESDGLQLHPHAEREDWTVTCVDTGLKTQTGGRIKRLQPWVGDETFMLTWGDGLADIDLRALLEFHRSHGKLATVTAVRPPARFGHLQFDGDRVAEFSEKPQTAEGWINGAFFVLEPGVFDCIKDGDKTHWEKGPMESLAREGQLMAYRHEGFWQCMDTLRDKKRLEKLWATGDAPWKTWEDPR